MSQQSPEPVPDESETLNTAVVLPFGRPQSEAQRAVQQRALESMNQERVHSKFRVTPVRALVTLAIATVPVALTYFAVDGVLRGMHMIEAMYDKQDAERAAKMPPRDDEIVQQQPGVVMLKPMLQETPAPPPENSAPAQ